MQLNDLDVAIEDRPGKVALPSDPQPGVKHSGDEAEGHQNSRQLNDR